MTNNWKNIPTLKDLKNEVSGAEYANSVKNSRITEYRTACLESDTPINIDKETKKRKSNYKSKLIEDEVLSAASELQYHITNPSRLFNVIALNNEESAREHSLLLHKQFDSIKSDLADESSVAFAIDGVLCLKTGWKLVEDTKEEVAPIMACSSEEALKCIESVTSDKKREKLKKMFKETGTIPIGFKRITKKIVKENRPTVTTINPSTLIVDPKAKRPSDIRFVVEVHETDYVSLINSKGNFINLKKLKEYIKNTTSEAETSTTGYDPYIDEDGMFEFSDMARKKFTVHEYWGYYDIYNNNTLEPIVAMWVGDILIRLEKSPYPFKELPYDFASYYPRYGSIWGLSIAGRLYHEQRSKTGLIRAMQDITDAEAADQEFVDTSIFVNDVQIANYKAGKTVYLKKGADPSRGIYKRNTTPVSPALFDQLRLYDNNTVNKTGNFTTDQIQYSATVSGNSEVIDGITYKKKSVIRRYLNIFEAVGKKITQMNAAFILEGDKKYSDNTDKSKLCDVNIDLLQEPVNVLIDILTSKDADSKAAKIISLMNTSIGSMSENTAYTHFKKVAELWGMPDVVASIEAEMEAKANYQPTEQELELQRLELEKLKLQNEKIKLDILSQTKEMENKDTIMLERLNRLELEVEKANKFRIEAEGYLSQAAANKYNAQTKLFNQSFDLVDSGIKRQQEKEDAEFQHKANLERESIRTARELELMNRKYGDKSKEDNSKKSEENIDPIVEYIRNGTIKNESYDTMDHVYRNVLDTVPEYSEAQETKKEIIKEAKENVDRDS